VTFASGRRVFPKPIAGAKENARRVSLGNDRAPV
jgi:hypothetical protein